MDSYNVERVLGLMAEAHQAMCAVRLQPWENEVTALVPKNPMDFGHFVHFVESLCETFRLWKIYINKQQSHNPDDVSHAEEAITRLALESRAIWDTYKVSAGIISLPR